MDNSIKFRWLGVAGIELTVGEKVLIIDPYFTRIPFWKIWFNRITPNRELIKDKITRCDFVLITHPHWDHLMDVPDVLRNTGATVFGSSNACRLLNVCWVYRKLINEIKVGDKLSLGNFHVDVLPATHSKVPAIFNGPLKSGLRLPLRACDYKMDDCFSFLISVAGYKLLNFTSRYPEHALPADVLFVSPNKDNDYYRALLRIAQPRVIIPNHWDNFFRPLSKTLIPRRGINLAKFKSMIERISGNTKVFIPEIFRAYDIADIRA